MLGVNLLGTAAARAQDGGRPCSPWKVLRYNVVEANVAGFVDKRSWLLSQSLSVFLVIHR